MRFSQRRKEVSDTSFLTSSGLPHLLVLTCPPMSESRSTGTCPGVGVVADDLCLNKTTKDTDPARHLSRWRYVAQLNYAPWGAKSARRATSCSG